jgi:hypothetical protein
LGRFNASLFDVCGSYGASILDSDGYPLWLVWFSETFPVEPRFLDGERVRSVRLDGQFTVESGSLLSDLGQVLFQDDETKDPSAPRRFSLVLPLPNEVMEGDVEAPFEVKFNLKSISPAGEIKEQELVLSTVPLRSMNFWQNRTQVAWIPYGIYSVSNFFGGFTQTRYYSAIFEASDELRFFRAISPYRRAFEVSIVGNLGWVQPIDGFTSPLYWSAELQLGVHHLLKNEAHTWSISPQAVFSVETFPLSSPTLTSSTSFETRSLLAIWGGLSCRFRWQAATRWFELVPEVQHSILANSSVPSLAGVISSTSAWKFSLQATIPIFYGFYSALKLTGLQGVGDVQLAMFMSSLALGYQF